MNVLYERKTYFLWLQIQTVDGVKVLNLYDKDLTEGSNLLIGKLHEIPFTELIQ